MSGRGRLAAAAALCAAALTVSACGGEDPDDGERTQRPAPETSYTEVEFTAADGEQRSGRLFGSGETAVVLSHMGRAGDGQDDWLAFAEDLAEGGFQVLTYEGRGALSEAWNDVAGAVDHLREGGAEKVVAAGASIGAMASLHATVHSETEVNGVLWLAGVLNNSGYAFAEADVSGIACPVLIASGEDDSYGAGDDAAKLHEWTAGVSELVLVDSNRHGTDILIEEEAAVAEELHGAMTDFLGRVAEEPAAVC
ncbi:alpha/beta hydrolase [Glycomyces tenuis]|uniref:alpha/beta hydrolase n=1 Tax=Glycomyces tenuis TaxID=58116 RepID=UPI00040D0E7E|nr:alpha/beta hydrolase [Glycomyces tenuis]